MKERVPTTLLLSGLVALVFYAGYQQWPDLAVTLSISAARPPSFLSASVLWVLLWLVYLPAVIWVAKTPPRSGREDLWALLWIVLLAALYRLVLLPGDPDLSSDFYRYLWDGRVFGGGVNPYALPPTSLALEAFRYDSLHAHLNRPDVVGVYPPLAQWVFRAVTALRPDAFALKLAFLAFEILGVLALLALLRREGRALSQVVVYLWNPLVVLEITRGGHTDAMMLPFLLLAVLCRRQGHMASAGFALGAATLARLYPLVILPALMARSAPGRRGLLGFEPRLPAAFILIVVLGYAPFLGMEGGLWGHLPTRMGSDWEEFNAGPQIALRTLLGWVAGVDDPWRFAKTASRVLLAGYALFALRILFKREGADQTTRRAAALLGGWLLLAMPSVEPWYAWGLVALSAVTLSPAWIWFSGAVGLSYLKYVVPSSLVPTWVLLVEYVPTLGLLARTAGRGAAAPTDAAGAEAGGWPRPLPPSDQRWTRIPVYVTGLLPIIAVLLVLYFFIAGFML